MRVRLDRGAGSGFGEQLVKYVLGELSLPGRLICDHDQGLRQRPAASSRPGRVVDSQVADVGAASRAVELRPPGRRAQGLRRHFRARILKS